MLPLPRQTLIPLRTSTSRHRPSLLLDTSAALLPIRHRYGGNGCGQIWVRCKMGSWDMDLGVVKGWVCPNPLQWQVYFAVPSVCALLSFSEGLWFCVLDTSLLLPRRNTIFYCIPVPLSMWIVAFLVVLFSTVYLALLEVFFFCLCCT